LQGGSAPLPANEHPLDATVCFFDVHQTVQYIAYAALTIEYIVEAFQQDLGAIEQASDILTLIATLSWVGSYLASAFSTCAFKFPVEADPNCASNAIWLEGNIPQLVADGLAMVIDCMPDTATTTVAPSTSIATTTTTTNRNQARWNNGKQKKTNKKNSAASTKANQRRPAKVAGRHWSASTPAKKGTSANVAGKPSLDQFWGDLVNRTQGLSAGGGSHRQGGGHAQSRRLHRVQGTRRHFFEKEAKNRQEKKLAKMERQAAITSCFFDTQAAMSFYARFGIQIAIEMKDCKTHMTEKEQRNCAWGILYTIENFGWATEYVIQLANDCPALGNDMALCVESATDFAWTGSSMVPAAAWVKEYCVDAKEKEKKDPNFTKGLPVLR